MNKYKHKTAKFIFRTSPYANYFKEGPCDDFCREKSTKKYLYHLKKDKSLSDLELDQYLKFLETLDFKGHLVKKDIKITYGNYEYSLSKEYHNNLIIFIKFLIKNYKIEYETYEGTKSLSEDDIIISDSITAPNSFYFYENIKALYLSNTRSIGSMVIQGTPYIFAQIIYLYFIKYAKKTKISVKKYNFINSSSFANIIIYRNDVSNSYNLYLLQLLRYVRRHPKTVKKILYLYNKHINLSSWDILHLVHTQSQDNNHNAYYDAFYKIKPTKKFYEQVPFNLFQRNLKSDSIVSSLMSGDLEQHFLSDIYDLKQETSISDPVNNLLINKLIYIGNSCEHFVTNKSYIPEKITKKSYGFFIIPKNKIIFKSKKLFTKN